VRRTRVRRMRPADRTILAEGLGAVNRHNVLQRVLRVRVTGVSTPRLDGPIPTTRRVVGRPGERHAGAVCLQKAKHKYLPGRRDPHPGPKRVRELAQLHAGPDPTPSAGSYTASRSGLRWAGFAAFDGHKRVAGPKRHLLVDIEGFLLAAVVHTVGASFPRLRRIWADQGYAGHSAAALCPGRRSRPGLCAGVPYAPEEVGGGTHFLLAREMPPHEQG
jgi:hypothetical protein